MSAASTARESNGADWRETPEDILTILQEMEKSVAKLRELSVAAGMKRNFTLDGRLVGDIGELLVARHYEIVRNEKPKGYAHDLYAVVGGVRRGVQVKLRCEGGGDLEFKYGPDILIVLECSRDWTQWREVYHGDGSVVVGDGQSVGKDLRLYKSGKRAVTTFSLEGMRHQRRREGRLRLSRVSRRE